MSNVRRKQGIKTHVSETWENKCCKQTCVLNCSDWSPASALSPRAFFFTHKLHVHHMHEGLEKHWELRSSSLHSSTAVFSMSDFSIVILAREKQGSETLRVEFSALPIQQHARAWPETTRRSSGEVPGKSSGLKFIFCVYGLLPSDHKVTHVPVSSRVLLLVLLSNKSCSSFVCIHSCVCDELCRL